MFARISNAWSLAKSSWAVLQKDRELAWLPVIGGVVALVVGAAVLRPRPRHARGGGEDNAVPPCRLHPRLPRLRRRGHASSSLSRAAVIHGANLRMEGGDPSVGGSLRGRVAHWPAVAGFAAISVTVGLILQAIRENGGIVGAIVSWIGDVAWGVLTYLVLPVIVIEGAGTVEGIKGSSALVKRTWGEQVTANVGFGLLNLVLVLPAVALVFVGGSLGSVGASISIGIAVVWFVAVSAVVATLTGIFQTALYRQATGRTIPTEFDARSASASPSPLTRLLGPAQRTP